MSIFENGQLTIMLNYRSWKGQLTIMFNYRQRKGEVIKSRSKVSLAEKFVAI